MGLPYLRLVLEGAMSVFFVRLLGAISSFSIMYILGRSVGAEGVGIYGFALSLVGVFALILRFGVDRTVIRDLSPLCARGEVEKITGYCCFLQRYLILGVLLVIPAVFAILLLVQIGSNILAIASGLELNIAVAAAASTALFISASVYQASQKFKLAAFIQFSAHQTLLLFVLLFFLGVGEALTPQISLMAYSVTALICAVCAIFSLVPPITMLQRLRTDFKRTLIYANSLFIRSRDVFIANAASMLMLMLDIFLLGILTDARAVGLYVVAQRVANSLSMLITPVDQVVATFIPRFYDTENGKEMNKIMLASRIIGVGIVGFIGLPILIFGEDLLRLFGADFSSAHTILIILLGAQFISAIAGPLAQQISLFDSHSQLAYRKMVLLMFLFALVGHFLVIPILGAEGAALITLLASCFLTLSIYVYMRGRVTEIIKV